MTKELSLKELATIPGVGKSIAADLWNIGIRKIPDLKGKQPEVLYHSLNKFTDMVQDRCVLYVFRCAVYFAETTESKQNRKSLNGGIGRTVNIKR